VFVPKGKTQSTHVREEKCVSAGDRRPRCQTDPQAADKGKVEHPSLMRGLRKYLRAHDLIDLAAVPGKRAVGKKIVRSLEEWEANCWNGTQEKFIAKHGPMSTVRQKKKIGGGPLAQLLLGSKYIMINGNKKRKEMQRERKRCVGSNTTPNNKDEPERWEKRGLGEPETEQKN